MFTRNIRLGIGICAVLALGGCMEPLGPNTPQDEETKETGKDQERGFVPNLIEPPVLV
ncbi:MAG TPA: hypothetical protein VK929_16845 [Longimicrobiales bacterium]|nr:hypothetical protein [Longimicrobiales bacterium]